MKKLFCDYCHFKCHPRAEGEGLKERKKKRVRRNSLNYGGKNVNML